MGDTSHDYRSLEKEFGVTITSLSQLISLESKVFTIDHTMTSIYLTLFLNGKRRSYSILAQDSIASIYYSSPTSIEDKSLGVVLSHKVKSMYVILCITNLLFIKEHSGFNW